MQDDTVKRVKDAADIVKIIGEFVDLKKAGKNYKGLCPFHKEKTPSFVVSKENQYFKCFGCEESGDVISFIMKRDNMTFREALEYLADKLGITIENTIQDRRSKIELEKFYRINKIAERFFYEKLLTSKLARDYLREREISSKSINLFNLGYAPDSWDMLYTFMMRNNIDPKDLLELGLVGISKNGNYYDRFRNRLIFPIYDLSKKIIGFGGRTLGDDTAKYINSPESLIYHKGNNLYALDRIQGSNYREKILLVEGYMDVIGLHQRGVNYAIATLGTALTEKQAKLIKRYGKNVFICYDSDDAGIKAANLAVDIFKNIGVSPSVILLDKGMDPDDYIKKYGKESFEIKLNNSLGAIDFQISLIINKYDLSDPSSMSELIIELSDYVNNFKSEVLRDEYINKIANKLEIRVESLRTDMDNFRNQNKSYNKFFSENKKEKTMHLPRLIFECILYSVADIRYYKELKYYLELLDDYNLQNIKDYINNEYEAGIVPIDIKKMSEDPGFIENERNLILKLSKINLKSYSYNEKLLIELMTRLDFEILSNSRNKLKRDISMMMSFSSDNMNKENAEKLREMLNRLKEIEIKLKTGNFPIRGDRVDR